MALATHAQTVGKLAFQRIERLPDLYERLMAKPLPKPYLRPAKALNESSCTGPFPTAWREALQADDASTERGTWFHYPRRRTSPNPP